MNDFEMRRRLESAAETIHPSAAGPVSDFVVEARSIRRRRRRALAGGVVATVVVASVGVGVGWDRWVGPDELSRDPAGGLERVVDPGVQEVTACSGAVARVFSPDGDGDVVAHSDSCGATAIVTGSDDDFDPVGSADGRLVAFVRVLPGGGARLMLLDRESGEMTALVETGARLGGPEFSPDARTVSFTLDEGTGTPHVNTVGVAGGDPIRTSDAAEREIAAAWSPEGTALTFVRAGRVVIHDLDTDEETTLDEAPDGLTLPFFGADGDGRVLYAVRPGRDGERVTYEVVRLDPLTGAVLAESAAYPGTVHDAVHDGLGVRVAATTGADAADPSNPEGVIRTLDAERLVEVGSRAVDGEPALVADYTGP